MQRITIHESQSRWPNHNSGQVAQPAGSSALPGRRPRAPYNTQTNKKRQLVGTNLQLGLLHTVSSSNTKGVFGIVERPCACAGFQRPSKDWLSSFK